MMKKLLFYMICLLVALSATKVYSQTNYFNGQILNKVFEKGSKATLLLYKNSPAKLGRLLETVPDIILSSPLSPDGSFSFEFDTPSETFYFTLKVYSKEQEIQELRKALSVNPYLSESNDSINFEFDIRKQSAFFSGIGSDKMNCQYLLNHFKEPSEVRGPYYFMGPFNKVEPFSSLERIQLAHNIYRNTIIEQFSGIVDEEILNQIKHENRALTKLSFVNFLLNAHHLLSDDVTSSLKDYFSGNMSISVLLSDDESLIDAPSYADFLLSREELRYRVKHDIGQRINNQNKYFNWMYNNLKENYDGLLRERLITTWFSNTTKQYFTLQINVMEDVLGIIKEDRYKKVLEQYTTFSRDNNIYPFQFIDENDQIHQPKDYKDKIIVMDFWFTGCPGCTMIPPVLEKIKERFKQNEDVVFLSISIDATKQKWETGLKTGQYTIPGQTHLKTQGDGRLDPFIMHYNIHGYPYLMVIGKNGKILSVNPKDPRLDQGEDIIRLIMEGIQI